MRANTDTDTATVNSIENTDGVENVEKVDRDIPSLTIKRKKNNITRLVVVGAMLVALIVVATGCAMFIKRLEEKKQQRIAEKAKERPKESAPGAKDFESAKKRIKQEEIAKLPPPASALAANAGSPPISATTGGTAEATGMRQGTAHNETGAGALPVGQPGNQAGGTGMAAVVTPAQRRLSGDVLVDVGTGSPQLGTAGHNVATTIRDSGTPPKNALDEKLKPSQLIAGVAAKRPDLSMLLRRSTMIPCGQYTYIKTSNPGAATCVISKDIYSANGDVLLIERGSTVFGEVRDGLSQGQESIPVLWSRIDTPRGVTVDINSLGTDALGASGVPVSVDNHLTQRFGGAVMLSLISDFGQALSNRASDSQGTLRLTTTSTAGQDLATKTLENTINIPPTGYSPNGSVIDILLLRDMDFRSVYELARY